MSFISPDSAPPVTLNPELSPPAASGPVFSTDRPAAGGGARGRAAVDHAAELVVHARAETPMTIGLFGAAGAGKSQALEHLIERARALASAAAKLGAGTPFISRLAVVRLSAPAIGEDASGAVASAIHEALTKPGQGQSFAAFARAAEQSATDPHTAAREANRLLDESRAQLEAERRTLADLDGRRARLGETLLYEAAGSRIDAYLRANRGKIETRMAGFGFTTDPIASYKDIVRDAAERGGASARLSTFARALWAYEGQARLIVWAIVFFLLAYLSGVAQDTRATWLSWVNGLSDQLQPATEWIGAHAAWFSTVRNVSIGIAILCLVADVWRALRFTSPVMRGAGLLRNDMDMRRRELDSHIEHQTRRVASLGSETEAHARNAAEAELRASEHAHTRAVVAPAQSLFNATTDSSSRQARAFLASIETAMAGNDEAPQRILIALDDLDALAPARAANVAEEAQRIAARRGFAMVICADAAHIASGWGGPAEAAQRLQRLVQIPLPVTLPGGDQALSDYARALLSGEGVPVSQAPVDASRSALDQPMSAHEADLLAHLAPIAGATPRAVKRFVNIYKLARAQGGDLPALALMLALDSGGARGELNALGAALGGEDSSHELVIHPAETRLVAALESANAARGRAMTIAEAQAAWHAASDYRLPL